MEGLLRSEGVALLEAYETLSIPLLGVHASLEPAVATLEAPNLPLQ